MSRVGIFNVGVSEGVAVNVLVGAGVAVAVCVTRAVGESVGSASVQVVAGV